VAPHAGRPADASPTLSLGANVVSTPRRLVASTPRRPRHYRLPDRFRCGKVPVPALTEARFRWGLRQHVGSVSGHARRWQTQSPVRHPSRQHPSGTGHKRLLPGPDSCPPAQGMWRRWVLRSSRRRVVWLLRGWRQHEERMLSVRLLGGELLRRRDGRAAMLWLVAHPDALALMPP
jgi:hypothetical protein